MRSRVLAAALTIVIAGAWARAEEREPIPYFIQFDKDMSMIVWGGFPGDSNPPIDTGGRYDPGTDTWTPTSLTDTPTARAARGAS